MKIIGNTVGTTMPRTNYNQTDPKKADYLVGRENIATKAEVTAEAERITNLEGRTTNLEGVTTNLTKAITHEAYATDASTAYIKVVPESPMPSATLSAEVSMLGGVSRKCTNLIPYPYGNTTQTKNGVTYTDNGDGTITANGTATGNSIYALHNYNAPLSKGTYTISGIPTNGSELTFMIQIATRSGFAMNHITASGDTFTLDTDVTDLVIQLVVFNGYTANGLTFKPMINEGATALPYEPYFGGLRSAKVTEVESLGKNLWDNASATLGSTTLTRTDTGFIIDRNTHTGATYVCYSIPLVKGQTITFSCVGSSYTPQLYLYRDKIYGKAVKTTYGKLIHTATEDMPTATFAVIISSADGSNEVSNIQAEFGETATLYTHYVRNTLPIPEAVQALDGYGDGVNETYYNYIDFDKKQFVRNVVKVVYNGTENWSAGTNSPAVEMAFSCALAKKPFQGTSTIHPVGVGISNVYEFNPVASDVADTFRMSTWDKIVWFYPSNFNSLEGWKAYLADLSASGNPLTIAYLLATPEVTDISDLLPNSIEVEGEGTLTFKNEHKIAMPSDVAYYMQVKGVSLTEADKREIARMVAEMLGSATS